ncbi:hypothetical protein ACIHCM_28790 [Streptomyces sp. NPDC052023]|uniref:hypothetical protein n=1 Tax=Streptomyces sp. NPDC052023 TaxID=3365681 RepID=UPI0037CDCAB2
MEQRIGTSSQPLDAGMNPAHIPGLTGPDKAAEPEPEDAAPVGEEAGEEASAPVEPEAEAEEADAGQSGGPVFEAADRRARIVADAKGVRLSLDDESCEFRWDEIGAIETESPRFGKRFTVTVHTPERRWYPIEIEAESKSRHKEWDEQLDAVLDAYFEADGDDDAAQDDGEPRD